MPCRHHGSCWLPQELPPKSWGVRARRRYLPTHSDLLGKAPVSLHAPRGPGRPRQYLLYPPDCSQDSWANWGILGTDPNPGPGQVREACTSLSGQAGLEQRQQLVFVTSARKYLFQRWLSSVQLPPTSCPRCQAFLGNSLLHAGEQHGREGYLSLPFQLRSHRGCVLLGFLRRYLVVGASITMTGHFRGGRLAKGQVWDFGPKRTGFES